MSNDFAAENALIDQLVTARFRTEDPRTPPAYRNGRPQERMDSPVYRCCLEALCRSRDVRSALEIGVKQGASVGVILANTTNLEVLVLCDFWTINAKKQHELRMVEEVLERWAHRHPKLRVIFKDGSSTRTLAEIDEQFDLIGIDGSHRRDVFRQDLLRALQLCNTGGAVVVDDLVLHDDCKLDQELMAVLHRDPTGPLLQYRDVTHWPGGAVVLPGGSASTVQIAVSSAIALGVDEDEAVRRAQLDRYGDEALASALLGYVDVQDWQAVAVLLPELMKRRSEVVDEALFATLVRGSLEIDNSSIKAHLVARGFQEMDGRPLESIDAVDGLLWRGPDRVYEPSGC